MKYLVAIFVALTIYGVVAGHYGAAIISLGMVAFVFWGARQLVKRDAEFYASPASAKTIPDTLEAMDKQEVESSGSRF
jgi:Zn-dependent protease with chaperone function